MIENIRQDWRRYAATSVKDRLYVLLAPTFWATTEYRFSHWARFEAPRWMRAPLVTISVFTHLLAKVLTGNSIHPNARIGPGVALGHVGGTVINGRVALGPGCTVSHEVTIGQDVNPPFGVPTLGKGVYVAAGAKIFGEITIGDHVAVGANAVVRDDLPDRAIAVGVPARVVRIQEPHEVRAAEIAR